MRKMIMGLVAALFVLGLSACQVEVYNEEAVDPVTLLEVQYIKYCSPEQLRIEVGSEYDRPVNVKFFDDRSKIPFASYEAPEGALWPGERIPWQDAHSRPNISVVFYDFETGDIVWADAEQVPVCS